MTLLRWVVGVELVGVALGALVFMGMYLRSRWSSTPAGRHWMLWTAVGFVDSLALLPLVLGLGGLWLAVLFAALYAAQLVLVWWRVVLLWRAQHQDD